MTCCTKAKTGLTPDNLALSRVKKSAFLGAFLMTLAHPFVAVAFTLHAELLESRLFAWWCLLEFYLVLALGQGRLCGVV